MTTAQIEEKLKLLYSQKADIEKEINSLEQLITNKKFSKDDKIGLFRELFVGRADIYAKEWKSSDNTKRAFYPVTQTFKGEDYLPLTNETLEQHLRGELVIATYPILKTNNSKYLVIKSPKEHLKKIYNLLKSYDIYSYIEKNIYDDFHIWVFFDGIVKAKDIREFSNLLFSKLKINLPIYPDKDYVTNSEFGKALELPLQLKQRDFGKTLFYDMKEGEVKDVWSYLSNVKKVDIKNFYEILNRYKVDFVDSSEEEYSFKGIVDVVLKDKIYVKHEYLSKNSINYLKSMVTFENPQVKTLLQLKKPLYNIQRLIKDFEEDEDNLILPRGVLLEFKNFLNENNAKFFIKDDRVLQKQEFPGIKFTLRKEQDEAINEILKYDYSICVAPPGFGKTLIGAKMIEQRQTNTLVIVNKNMLLDQWIERFISYFEMDKKDIGFLGKGKNKLNGTLDIATMQSLKNSMDVIKEYSFVIVDECHHIPAFTFEKIIKEFRGKYILGLSATPKRKDGLEKILYHQLGHIAYEHKTKKTKNNQVYVINSEFTSQSGNFSELITEIANNEPRNKLIVDLTKKYIDRKILILTDRVEHISILSEMLIKEGINPLEIHGGLSKKDQDEAMELALKSSLIIATTSFFGEGIDFAHLNTIIFATPISFYGRLIQYLGRVGRGGDDSIALDIVDNNHPMLLSTFKKRKEGYKKMHYSIKYK